MCAQEALLACVFQQAALLLVYASFRSAYTQASKYTGVTPAFSVPAHPRPQGTVCASEPVRSLHTALPSPAASDSSFRLNRRRESYACGQA
jgi:hypothetical protein